MSGLLGRIREQQQSTFTALVSNPPYQTKPTENTTRTYPLWPEFVVLSEALAEYITIINPARWLNGGSGTGLNDIRTHLLTNGTLKQVTILPTKVFPNIDVGDVAIEFITKHDSPHKIELVSPQNGTIVTHLPEEDLGIVISDPKSAEIVCKIIAYSATERLSSVEQTLWTGGQDNRTKRRSKAVSASLRNDYGIRSPRMVRDTDYFVTEEEKQPNEAYLKVYYWEQREIKERFLPLSELQDTPNNRERVPRWKAVIPQTHCQSIYRNTLFAAEPYSLTTNSWLCRTFEREQEVEGFFSYVRTYFYRFLLVVRRTSHHALANVHRFVPDLQHTRNPRTNLLGYNSDWTDADLETLFKDVLSPADWEHIKLVAETADNSTARTAEDS